MFIFPPKRKEPDEDLPGRPCPTCRGTGDSKVACPICGGGGKREGERECFACHGKGRIQCLACNGVGTVATAER